MFRDRAQDALTKAAVPALERIRRDQAREGLPRSVGKLLAHFEAHLFDSRLNVASARKAAGVGDNSVSTVFKAWVGSTPRSYLARCRLETAARMLRATDLPPGRISRAVGFESYETFYRAYKAWTGAAPTSDRDARLAPELDYRTWRRTLQAELSAEEKPAVVDALRRVLPELSRESREREAVEPPRIVVDGAEFERFEAERLWRAVRDLPFDEQARRIRCYRFHSTALFDLLRTTSRVEGRSDRQRGIRLARLALVSLEEHDEVFGGRIHDLRALGWAWLANARRLALDLAGAEEDFECSDREWGAPRESEDLRILAQIQFYKGTLRMFQEEYDQALELLTESSDLSELAGDSTCQIQTLIQRAVVYYYRRETMASIHGFREALVLAEQHGAIFLTFIALYNLANLQARAGSHGAALEKLEILKGRSKLFDYPQGKHHVRWLEGFILYSTGDEARAETLYQMALEGFLDDGDPGSFTLTSLDLAILYADRRQQNLVIEYCKNMLPSLAALRLGKETLVAVGLFKDAVTGKKVDAILLRQVRDCLRQDPLLCVAQDVG